MWTDRQPLLSADAFLISINRRSHHTILHGINYSTCLNSVPTYRDISIFYRESPHEFNLSTKSCASFFAFRSVLIGSGLLPARVTPIVRAEPMYIRWASDLRNVKLNFGAQTRVPVSVQCRVIAEVARFPPCSTIPYRPTCIEGVPSQWSPV